MQKTRPATGATRAAAASASASNRAERWTGPALFALALLLRILFWQATPDAAWPHSAAYKGDAVSWTEQARAIQTGSADRDLQAALPLRPPGAAYLIAWTWNGLPSGLARVQLLWSVLGAATVWLLYSAARRSFGRPVAVAVGLVSALSHGLMVLSTSLNNETPYLFVVAVAFRLWPALRDAPDRPGLQVAWGAVQALGCLVRVEHLAVAVLCHAWLLADPQTRPTSIRDLARRTAPAIGALVLVLLPWHLAAWRAIERFDTVEPTMPPAARAAQAQIEQSLAFLEWTPEAQAERDALPAFARRTAANFVAATVAYRGGHEVAAEDFDLLEQAFGSRPEPLGMRPFVALYGGLNLYLAHNPDAAAGFSRAALDQPPPLAGGPYPPFLVGGLPPPDLAFAYPPHLDAIRHGTPMALRYMLDQPGTTLRRMATRLDLFWQGATLGLGGTDLPLSWLSDRRLRRKADLAVPETALIVRTWQLAWLALCVAGLWTLARNPDHLRAAVPWLALLATKAVVSAVFFGYARHGATAIPVVALLAVLAVAAWTRWRNLPPTTGRSVVAVVVVLVCAVEIWRFAAPPEVQIDGRPVGVEDPWPADVHADRIVQVRNSDA